MEFDAQFAQLNDKQKKAVQYIDGPLLVVAGPGTGKTQLLSARVAYILKNTDTKAKDILCLTFTNKAAHNMQQRIIGITGGTSDVCVRTFHSFASDVMNMYPDYFWNSARLSTAPDGVQYEIIQSILSSLPLDNPLALKFAGKFTVAADVQKALSLTKEAGLTPEKLKALLDVNVAYIDLIEADLSAITEPRLSIKKLAELQTSIQNLPDQNVDASVAPLLSLSHVIKSELDHAVEADLQLGKTSNTGEWKKKWIQTVNGQRGMFKERQRNVWWTKVAEVYEHYRRHIHQRGYYDYSDMLVEVLTQLEQHPEMLADIQERYLYVMIDEFQDTNPAQLRLAHLVANHHSADGNPNIMAVGDDDQSIFKFNGAELNNLLTFGHMYPSAKTIVLTDNYRSSQAIIDVAEQTIAKAEDRLVTRNKNLIKKLVAKNPPLGSSEIRHYQFATAEEQFSAAAMDIKQNFNENISIAVIARGHESLRMVASRLLALNVPVHYEQQQNVLEHLLVRQATLIAEIVCGIGSGDISAVNAALSKTLAHPMWNITPRDLWGIAIDNFRDPDWLSSLESSANPTYAAHAQWLLDLAQESVHESLPVTLEYLLGLRQLNDHKGPIYDYFASRKDQNVNEYLHGLSALRYLRSLATEFSTGSKPTIEDLVTYIQLQNSRGEIVTDESPFISGNHAVSLLSVHKSKGLEFDRVYIIDAVEKNWQPRSGGRKPPSNLPLQPAGDEFDDYVRLMFVAMTRARKDLFICSYTYDEKNSEIFASSIITNILPPEAFTRAFSPVTLLEQSMRWPRLDNGDEKLMLKNRLDGLSLSVTHLINYLDLVDCGPNGYLERNLLRLPSVKAPHLSHGTAMHAALELAQKQINGSVFNLTEVQKRYSETLAKEHLTLTDQERYSSHGQQLLSRLFMEGFLELTPGSAPEQDINDVFIGTIHLTGTLDRIDPNANGYTVVDYKTGTPLSSFTTKNSQLEVKAWKQRMQLIFYALLMQKSPRFITDSKTITGQMIYLEAEDKNSLSRIYQPSPEEITRLEALIGVVWGKIMDLDFPDTNGYTKNYEGIQQFEDDLLSGAI